jgi:hypothetical protein
VEPTRHDKVNCLFCGRRMDLLRGRVPRHAVGGRLCLGSGRAVIPEAFGPVRWRIRLGGTTCIACGQQASAMTVHDKVHAVWPCGDWFEVSPVPPEAAESPSVPPPRTAVRAALELA